MNVNSILFNISYVFVFFVCVSIILTIRSLVLLWIEVKKARTRFQELTYKFDEVNESVVSIAQKVTEIEHTPLIRHDFVTKRYGKAIAQVIKSQNKYRMKKMRKQEKQLKKRIKYLKKQTKVYEKDTTKGSYTYGK